MLFRFCAAPWPKFARTDVQDAVPDRGGVPRVPVESYTGAQPRWVRKAVAGRGGLTGCLLVGGFEDRCTI